jgi:hypothetical protein
MNCLRFTTCALLIMARMTVASAAIEEPRQQALEPVASADNKSEAPSFSDSATIEAGTGDTKATITVGGFLPYTSGDWYYAYQLGGEAAVSKGSEGDVTVGSLSGLAQGSSASTKFTFMHWAHAPKSVTGPMQVVCAKAFSEVVDNLPFDDIAKTGLDVGCDETLFDAAKLKTVLDKWNALRKVCATASAESAALGAVLCSSFSRQAADAALSAKGQQPGVLEAVVTELQSFKLLFAPAHLFSLGAKANRKKANYFLEPDFAQLKKGHTTGYGASATYSFVRQNRMHSGGFSLEKTYKGGDEVEVCAEIAGSTALRCITGPIGAPKHKYGRIAFAESRWIARSGRLGWAPRAEYDFSDSTYAIRIPIYVAPNKEKALIGGIAIGYTNKDDEGFGAAVFIGKALSLFD